MATRTKVEYKEFLTQHKAMIFSKQKEWMMTTASMTLYELGPLYWSLFKALYSREVSRRFMRDIGVSSDRRFIRYCNGETLETMPTLTALEEIHPKVANKVFDYEANDVRARVIINNFMGW